MMWPTQHNREGSTINDNARKKDRRAYATTTTAKTKKNEVTEARPSICLS